MESKISSALEEGRVKGLAEGREEGDHDAHVFIAIVLFDVIADDALIAEKTGLSVEQVSALRLEHQGPIPK